MARRRSGRYTKIGRLVIATVMRDPHQQGQRDRPGADRRPALHARSMTAIYACCAVGYAAGFASVTGTVIGMRRAQHRPHQSLPVEQWRGGGTDQRAISPPPPQLNLTVGLRRPVGGGAFHCAAKRLGLPGQSISSPGSASMSTTPIDPAKLDKLAEVAIKVGLGLQAGPGPLHDRRRPARCRWRAASPSTPTRPAPAS